MSHKARELDQLFGAVLSLIFAEEGSLACTLFNKMVYPNFHDLVQPEQPLHALFPFFVEMDEYFNSPGRQAINPVDPYELKEWYDSSLYQDDLQEALANEK